MKVKENRGDTKPQWASPCNYLALVSEEMHFHMQLWTLTYTPKVLLCFPMLHAVSVVILTVSLSFSLCSERFFVRLNKQGLPKSPEKTERQCTLFVVSMDFFGVHQGRVLGPFFFCFGFE